MVSITEHAAQKVKDILKQKNKEDPFIRLQIVGQGCSRPHFGMTLEESKTEEDTLDVEYGVSLIANKELTTHLSGSIIEFVESLTGGGFQIRNGEIVEQIYGEFGYK